MEFNKEYTVFFIAIPNGTVAEEGMYDYMNKYNNYLPPAYAMGIELAENETIEDLTNNMREILEHGGANIVNV